MLYPTYMARLILAVLFYFNMYTCFIILFYML